MEDMYIPSRNERYIMKGYTVVKRTVTGKQEEKNAFRSKEKVDIFTKTYNTK